MKEKYFFIEPEKARELLSQAKKMKPAKHGIDSRVYLIGEYAVLTTSRIKLRNVATRDDNLAYFDELIETLMRLQEQGVGVVPILGYCYDPDSENGNGWIFQPRAKGEELYDDALMKKRSKKYMLARTNDIAQAPQAHYDKFIRDMLILFDHDILIDFHGKSNFFYDETAGFQFIDLDSHTDYKYGLAAQKHDAKQLACIYGFTPVACNNRTIFEKYRTAILNNGIPEEQLNRSLELYPVKE